MGCAQRNKIWNTAWQVQLNAIANVPGVFEYNPGLGELLKAGKGQSLRLTFIPDNKEDYNTVESRTSIDVELAKPELIWFKPSDIDAGTELSEIQLNAKAGVSV